MLMKKTFGILALSLVFLLTACGGLFAPLDLAGDWEGHVTVGTLQTPVAFSLDARGRILAGTFSDVGSDRFGSYAFSSIVTADGISITAIASSTISGITVGSAKVDFDGKANGDTIAGDFRSIISAPLLGATTLEGTFSITRQ
jgi:hypothetical protein